MRARAVQAWRALLEKLGPRGYRILFNLYPPYFGAGVQVTHISDDVRRIDVRMPLTPLNQNYLGTHFGGSLYSMCDPFLLFMLMKALGPGYVVWDKAASIEFLRPGRGTVHARFEIGDEQLHAIRTALTHARRHEPVFTVDVTDDAGNVIARVHKTLYVRQGREKLRENGQ